MSIIFKARYRRILWFFGGVILSILWWDIFLKRIGLHRLAVATRRRRVRAYAVAFRNLAIKMGGVMIKVGQFLSARVDVLPVEVTEELTGLQDEVAPEKFEAIRSVLEADFGCPLAEKFSQFDPAPLAAASIGQVHRAVMRLTEAEKENAPENLPVVVKVQRPDIPVLVEIDLAALRVVSRWVNLYAPIRKRADVPALLKEFSNSLFEEIDYLAEGKNAEIFAANFAGREDVRVPHVYWSHTTRRVLTLEDVMAIKITDYAALDAAGVDRGEVANRLIDTYLKQIFEDRFFHADPHPGNLFVYPLNVPAEGEKADWKLVFVDFGMVGHILAGQFEGFRDLLVGTITRDMPRVIKGYQQMGVLLPGTDLNMLERAGSAMMERIWGKTVPEMVDSMQGEEGRRFVHEFGDMMVENPFQIPQNMILFGRCLAILSGICTGLSADFNVFRSVEPYARKLVAEEQGSSLDVLIKEVTRYLTLLISIPNRTESLINRLEAGRLEVRTPGLEAQMKAFNHSIRRLATAVVFLTFVTGAIQFYLAGDLIPARWLGAGGILALLFIFFR
jgi:predicted unusual protein kinase regulating ubiquinone biosynthesis (AarF/ABC1/UbiB family)